MAATIKNIEPSLLLFGPGRMWELNVDWNERFQQACKLARDTGAQAALPGLLECVLAEPQRVDFAAEFLQALERVRPAGEALPAAQNGSEEQVDVQAQRETILQQWPQRLVQQTEDPDTLFALAQAHLAAGHRPVALAYVEFALRRWPDQVNLLRLQARILTHLHRDEEALACWKEVEALHPQGTDAIRAITQLVLRGSRRRAGWTRGEPLVDEVPPAPLAEPVVMEMPAVVRNALYDQPEGPIKLTPVQKLQHAVNETPSLVELYLYLVPLYLEKGLDYSAEKLLTKGLEATDNDPRIRQLWEEVSLGRLDKQIAEWRKDITENPSPHTEREIERLTIERDELALRIYADRTAREPENHLAFFEYGLRLKQAGRLAEACPALDKAAEREEQAVAAHCELGDCWEQQGDLARALMSYQHALDVPHTAETLPYRTRALYGAGRLAKKMRLVRAAGRYLRELLQIAPNYADAAALLQSLAPVATKEPSGKEKLAGGKTE
jgi:tetratricopeptide (TPR) repeat protein